jgi:phosphoribosylanthranilate isomerase
VTVLVKICGITNPGDAAAAAAAGADLLGVVFVPGTPRAVDPERATWVRELSGIATVGVFRDAPLDLVLDCRRALALDWVQLHGAEPEDHLDQLGSQVLRRVPADNRGVDWQRVAELSRRCLPLLDPGAGDGVALDWVALPGPPRGLRFGLAGGLDPDNVGAAIAALRPVLVDVSSGVERAPGIKDPSRVEAFVRAARAATAGR